MAGVQTGKSHEVANRPVLLSEDERRNKTGIRHHAGRSDSRQSEGHRQKKERRPVHLLGYRERIIQKFQEV